ncbi:transposase [Tahibacter harae]|uniref:Transposase n=1 Tax=Tahibacter harae TaxID=2963937 RepID=A0ABT1QWK6_9GAMM|nr:transposase [Tahibacter harae]MCQ4166667.1 transposase [Tahibacter harae]
MARLPRLDLPGIPQHVIQRGNNPLPCFPDSADRQRYLHILHGALPDTGMALHAYVLMSNRVHLLLAPPRLGAVSCLMQALGRRYVRAFNSRRGRTGTLWEGRYEPRPRATDAPAQFPCSSCASLCGQRDDVLPSPHPAYTALSTSRTERATAYRALLATILPDDELQAIRSYLQQQRALGRDSFRAMVEAKTRRLAGICSAHRPALRRGSCRST